MLEQKLIKTYFCLSRISLLDLIVDRSLSLLTLSTFNWFLIAVGYSR